MYVCGYIHNDLDNIIIVIQAGRNVCSREMEQQKEGVSEPFPSPCQEEAWHNNTTTAL